MGLLNKKELNNLVEKLVFEGRFEKSMPEVLEDFGNELKSILNQTLSLETWTIEHFSCLHLGFYISNQLNIKPDPFAIHREIFRLTDYEPKNSEIETFKIYYWVEEETIRYKIRIKIQHKKHLFSDTVNLSLLSIEQTEQIKRTILYEQYSTLTHKIFSFLVFINFFHYSADFVKFFWFFNKNCSQSKNLSTLSDWAVKQIFPKIELDGKIWGITNLRLKLKISILIEKTNQMIEDLKDKKSLHLSPIDCLNSEHFHDIHPELGQPILFQHYGIDQNLSSKKAEKSLSFEDSFNFLKEKQLHITKEDFLEIVLERNDIHPYLNTALIPQYKILNDTSGQFNCGVVISGIESEIEQNPEILNYKQPYPGLFRLRKEDTQQSPLKSLRHLFDGYPSQKINVKELDAFSYFLQPSLYDLITNNPFYSFTVSELGKAFKTKKNLGESPVILNIGVENLRFRVKELEDFCKKIHSTQIEDRTEPVKIKPNCFKQESDFWVFRFAGKEEKTRSDLKGFKFIRFLLESPQKTISVGELHSFYSSEKEETFENNANNEDIYEFEEALSVNPRSKSNILSNIDEMHDQDAIQNYTKQVKKLNHDIEKETNTYKKRKLEEEKDLLIKLIQTGKSEKYNQFKNEQKLMRDNVNKLIKYARQHIGSVHKELYEHLKEFLPYQPGGYYTYQNNDSTYWETRER